MLRLEANHLSVYDSADHEYTDINALCKVKPSAALRAEGALSYPLGGNSCSMRRSNFSAGFNAAFKIAHMKECYAESTV